MDAAQLEEAGSEELGVNIAVLVGESYVTVPLTVVVPHVRIKVLALIDAETTSSLKVALTVVFEETPDAPFAGLTV
jgi:hypothetical protein